MAATSSVRTLPAGPVLYAATRDSVGVWLVPVGEVVKDSISPFRDEKSAPGYRGAFARKLMEPGARFTRDELHRGVADVARRRVVARVGRRQRRRVLDRRPHRDAHRAHGDRRREHEHRSRVGRCRVLLGHCAAQAGDEAAHHCDQSHQ